MIYESGMALVSIEPSRGAEFSWIVPILKELAWATATTESTTTVRMVATVVD